jgi:Domain of unknown function (DUF4410)
MKMKWTIRIGTCAVAFACQLGSAQKPAPDHVGNAFLGGAKLEILQRYQGPEMLPMPTQVVIQDFANKGTIVTDTKRSLLLAGSGLPPSSPVAAGASSDELVQQIRDSFAKTLIAQFKKMNVESVRASDASAVVGPALIVQGEFTVIAPGNSRKRIIIGFGRGASDLKTHVTITEVANSKRTVLLECNIDSKSGKQPGAMMSPNLTAFAVGVVLGHMGDKKNGTVQADGARMAKLIGKQAESITGLSQWITKPSTD